jgi:hypothetical protein
MMAISRKIQIEPKRESRRLNAFAILVGASVLAAGLASAFKVRVIGNLPLAEILFLPLMPILVFIEGRQMIRPTMRPLLILLGVWLVGQIVTDVYRGTVFFDWARGDANIIFFGIDLLALIALLGRSESRKVIFVLGISFGHLLAMKFQPVKGSQSWKFGPGPAVNMLVVLCICYFLRRRNYAVVLLLLISISAVNVIENFRSIVLFLFITAALTVPIIPERVGRLRLLPKPGTSGRIFALAALALGAGGAALGVIELATKSGLLGEAQQRKNESQAKSPGGILIGGRPEILVSSRAIIDSPILGHGSKAKDPRYVEMLNDLEQRYGITETSPDTIEANSEGAIPSHSFLLDTWVSAGVLGAVFWIYLLQPAFKAILRVPLLQTALAPLYAYVLVTLIWNIFFSSFAGLSRVLAAFAIVILADQLEAQTPGMTIKSSRSARNPRRRPITWRAAV